MKITEMWRGTLTTKVLLIIVGLMLFSVQNDVLWLIVGTILLIVGCLMSFRQGQGAGHDACGVLASVEKLTSEGREVDDLLLRQAYRPGRGWAAVFLGGLIDYVINSIYIILTVVGAAEAPVLISRLLSWAVSVPYLAPVALLHETYTALTPDLIIIFLIGPFLLPLFQCLGYLQGPKLWANSEKAMAEGRRRAKARSRIVKKKQYKPRKPEI